MVVEAQAVDDGAIFAQAEDARLRVSVLRARRDRSGFDEAEAEAQHRFGHFGVLVEAGGETDRVGEVEAQRLHAQARVVRLTAMASALTMPSALIVKRVRELGVEAAQDRPRQS